MYSLISELSNRIQKEYRLTAVGIAVGHKDKQLDISVSGTRRHKSNVPVELADKWHIGSITKSITATVIGKLVEDSVLNFDAPVPELLPAIPMHATWSECTLEHLLTHTSGLPANFAMRTQKINPKSMDQLVSARRDAIQQIFAIPPKNPVGSVFRYSNIGYTVVGHIAETMAPLWQASCRL